METSITVERLNYEETEEFLPSHEILRENLKAVHRRKAKKPLKDYKCKICRKVFSDKFELQMHGTLHDPECPFQCEQCSYKTKNRKYLSRHILKVHNKQRKNQECDICGKRFFFKCLLDKHFRIHSGEKPNKCDVCGKAFNSRYSLNTHKLIHTNEKPYKCSFCDYACRDSSTLRKHHSNHLGLTKSHPCEKCPSQYNTKERLIAHVNEKHAKEEEATLSCDNCGMMFKKKWTLASHIRAVHEKMMSCTCGVCGKVISNRANLKSHLRVHIDARPYKCTHPGCKKKFKDNSALRKHTVIHYPVKQLACSDCGRRFTRRNRLTLHLKRKEASKDGLCPKYYGKKYVAIVKVRDPNAVNMICDTCGFRTISRTKLVKHIKYGHGNLEDRECRICKKTFRKNEYLKLHYCNSHSVKYKTKTKLKLKPMVIIKQEPEDIIPDMEIDLFDIEKQEPLDDIDADISSNYIQDQTSTLTLEAKHDDNEEREVILQPECNEIERLNDISILNENERLNDKDTPLAEDENMNDKDVSEKTLEENAELNDINICEPNSNRNEHMNGKDIEQTFNENELVNEIDISEPPRIKNDVSESKHSDGHVKDSVHQGIEKAENPKDGNVVQNMTKESMDEHNNDEENLNRPSMQMSDFIQHIILAEQSDEDIEDEDTEKYMQKRIEELMRKSNEKNGIRHKLNNIGRKLKKIDNIEANDILLKLTQRRETADDDDGEVLPEEQRETDKTLGSRRKGRRIEKGSKGVQYLKSSSEQNKLSENISEREGNSEAAVKEKRQNKGNVKLKFNIHQCYVCYKLFNTKPDLINHCKVHFDVCNEVTLKKCPLCPFVTHANIKRHIRLMHKIDINFSFMRINDKKTNDGSSRYYFDIHNDNVKKLDIIPSIKILNKKASMDLDKRNRELKDKSVLKRKLIKRGKEWIVEHEKLDVSKLVVPDLNDLKQKSNYLESLRQLNLECRRKGKQILYPCNVCDKVCQNLSALTLHLRKHDPNAKPFKPKIWKHKMKGQPVAQIVETVVNTENRNALPKPIVNKHKCDPKLKDFYEKNIKGGDIEFWQFLKIYNKMSRENVNDFRDLETRTEFGIHYSDTSENNNKNNNVTPLDGNGNDLDDVTANSNSKDSENININYVSHNLNKKKETIDKFVKKINVSREEYKKRCEAKAKLREKIARNNS